MNKIKQILTNRKILYTSLGLLIGLFIIIFLYSYNSITIKKIDNETLYLQYDNTWKIKEKEQNKIILKHNSGSKITIQIAETKGENKYLSVDDIIDEITYNIKKQNTNYKLITSEKKDITKYEYEGYNLLYESNDKQVMISFYKKSDKLVSIIYEAQDDYFDMLLDSVNNIIYNLDVKDVQFNLNKNLEIKTTKINYSKNEKLDKTLTKTKTYEIAKKNYLVTYSIPDNFTQVSINSTNGYFKYNTNDKNEITINVDIFNKNLYEYLDKNETLNLYNNYKYYREDKSYSDFTESLSKLKSNFDSYIYLNSYYSKAVQYDKDFNKKEYKKKNENIELIYAINKDHILRIVINSSGEPLTKKLINQIKIISSKNYSSYIKSKKENGYIISELQTKQDQKVKQITLKVPDKYKEIDKGKNINAERYYGIDYIDDMNIYKYEIHYELTNISPEEYTKTINSVYMKSTYGKYKKLAFDKHLTLNDKKFQVYTGGYTSISGILFTDVNRKKYYVNKTLLFYTMTDGDVLCIEINGNDKTIPEKMLKELTNFTIEVK